MSSVRDSDGGGRLTLFFFFSSRRRHTRLVSDWSSDVCSSDLERLRAKETGALEVRRPDRGEEDESLDARALGRAQEARRPEAVHLLEPPWRLVADRGAEVDHRLHAPQRVPEPVRIAEVSEGDLHVHALGAKPPRL